MEGGFSVPTRDCQVSPQERFADVRSRQMPEADRSARRRRVTYTSRTRVDMMGGRGDISDIAAFRGL